MPQLPTEVLSLIFKQAIANHYSTGPALCLVNKAFCNLARPYLYKHICLQGLEQVELFSTRLQDAKDNLKLFDAIHSLTFSFPREFELKFSSALDMEIWYDINEQIRRLVQFHKLDSLAIDEKGFEELQLDLALKLRYRLEVDDVSLAINEQTYMYDILEKKWVEQPRLKHLLLSSLGKMQHLQIFMPKRLTIINNYEYFSRFLDWMTNSFPMCKWIEEIDIIISIRPNGERHGYKYTSIVNIDLLKQLRENGTRLNIICHRSLTELKQIVEMELREGELKDYLDTVKIGEWGIDSHDKDQESVERCYILSGQWREDVRLAQKVALQGRKKRRIEDVEGEQDVLNL